MQIKLFCLSNHVKNAQILKKVDSFLAEKGLDVKEAKTKLIKSNQIFKLLEWNFKIKAKNNKLVSYPSKNNPFKMITNIKKTVCNTR